MRVALFLFLGTLLTAQTGANQLLGRWRAVETSPNGRTAFFEFHDGNRLDYVSGQALDGHYRMIDSKSIAVSTPDHGEEQEEMTWSGPDKMTIENKAINQSVSLTRVGKMADPDHPIVGDWTGERVVEGNKVETLYIFYPDNRNLWVLKLKNLQGTYTVSGDTIKLNVPEHPETDGPFATDGDTLSLPNPGGSGSTRFNRY
jgi:hypothetical protein